MKFAIAAAGAALLAAGAASAQSAAETSAAARAAAEPRISQLIVYGDDPCPTSSDEEIVVCARKPETERYRIPEDLREGPEGRARSWTERAGRDSVNWNRLIEEARQERLSRIDADAEAVEREQSEPR